MYFSFVAAFVGGGLDSSGVDFVAFVQVKGESERGTASFH